MFSQAPIRVAGNKYQSSVLQIIEVQHRRHFRHAPGAELKWQRTHRTLQYLPFEGRHVGNPGPYIDATRAKVIIGSTHREIPKIQIVPGFFCHSASQIDKDTLGPTVSALVGQGWHIHITHYQSLGSWLGMSRAGKNGEAKADEQWQG
jgi:hypothetical protein